MQVRAGRLACQIHMKEAPLAARPSSGPIPSERRMSVSCTPRTSPQRKEANATRKLLEVCFRIITLWRTVMKGSHVGSVVIVAISMLLSGCGVDTRPTPEQSAADEAQCARYGYQPGSNRFADCMMHTADRRAANLEQQQRDAARWRENAQRQDSAWASGQQDNQSRNNRDDSNCTSTSTTQQDGNTSSSKTVTKCHNVGSGW